MHVTFLLPQPEYPRFEKRIAALRSLGFSTRVMAFGRSERLEQQGSERLESLGVVRDGDVVGRGFTYLRVLPRIRRAMEETDILYCFGVDLLALVRLAGRYLRRRPRLVVEAGDIPDVLCSDTVKSQVVRCVERRVLGNDVLLVVTSPTYIDAYYHRIQQLRELQTLVIENKVDARAVGVPAVRAPRQWDGTLRIGYFGLLRGGESWDVLKRLASAGGERVKVALRGFPLGEMRSLIREAEMFENITYGGSYRAPQDLGEMYGEIDVSWIVHYGELPNWRWARSNRFYESCYFSVPMIGQEGKDDTRLLVEHDLGTEIDVTRPDEAVSRVLAISREDLERWSRNFESLPRHIYVLSDEHERLAALLAEG